MPHPAPAPTEPQSSSPANALMGHGAAGSCGRRRRPGLARIAALLMLLGLILGAGGCNSSSRTTSRPLCIAGSTSVQPFAEKLAEIYMQRHPGARVDVQGGGSSAGIYAATHGAADLGASSRELLGEEKKLVEIPIAFDGIAVIVHPSNPLTNITLAQIRAIFSGAVKDWRALGLPPHAIDLITREEGSGTREAFEHLVMGKQEITPAALVQDSNGSVREIVAGDPYSLGYISAGLVDHRVKALAIDGVLPTRENIKTHAYKLVRRFLLVARTAPGGSCKAFRGLRPGPQWPEDPRIRRPGGGELMHREKFIERVLLVLALSSIGSLALITIFIFLEGFPLILSAGLKNFILSSHWAPTKGHFGILAMIISSVLVTLGAMVIGVPLGLSCAMVLAEFSPKRLKMVLKPTLELLAGIPSVVYGFLGVICLVPLIRNHLGGPGLSLLAASIILGIMILPTVISISIDALTAVPDLYRDGSLALGATRWQTVSRVVLPAASSGIITAIILGMGRAIGETMAVIMVAGNALQIPTSVLDPVRTLTSNIALELGYAAGRHREALFATGIVLFIIIMILNLSATLIARRR